MKDMGGVFYVLLIKLKLGLYILGSAIVAGICYRLNIDTNDLQEWFNSHIYYITCGPIGLTTALATQVQQPDYSSWSDFALQRLMGLVYLIISVLITFFLTRWLKYRYAEIKVPVK